MPETRSQEIIERLFDSPIPAKLKIINIRGSIYIQPNPDPVLSVTAIKHLQSGDEAGTKISITQEADGTVSVETRFQKSGWRNSILKNHQACNVDYTIHIPNPCSVNLESVSSTTRLKELEGNVTIKTISGDIILSEIEGAIQINGTSADITGDHLVGPLDVTTVSGDLTLKQSQPGLIKASSISGSFFVDVKMGTGPFNFKSISGDLDLVLPPETCLSIDYKSVSGDLKSGIPVTYQEKRSNHQILGLHGGGPLVEFKTTSGDFIIKTSPVAESFSSNLPPSLTRLSILEKIDTGELTTGEGLKLLQA
jgi:hypothetical protein